MPAPTTPVQGVAEEDKKLSELKHELKQKLKKDALAKSPTEPKNVAREEEELFSLTKPRTCHDFAIRLSVRLSLMAKKHEARTWEAGNTSYEAEAKTLGGSKKLEEYFCVEVSDLTFQLLHKLLDQVLSTKTGVEDERISKFAPSLIKLVEVNLNRLVKSKIDPKSVGIVIADAQDSTEGNGGDKTSPSGTFDRILPLLMGVMKPGQGDVLHALQQYSAAAIDAGVDVLFPCFDNGAVFFFDDSHTLPLRKKIKWSASRSSGMVRGMVCTLKLTNVYMCVVCARGRPFTCEHVHQTRQRQGRQCLFFHVLRPSFHSF